MTTRWGVVVPVKLLALAKTRLAVYGEHGRSELALAFAEDVVTALRACPDVAQVLVVTDDARAAAVLAGPGVRVVPDLHDAGQNPALEHGAALLREDDGDLGVCALSSDLPSLRPDDLADALGRVAHRGFVADAAGSGTTLLAAAPGSELGAAYGPGSRERHLLSGAQELPAAATLRRDVDTPEDLRVARELGVGVRTAEVLRLLGPT